MASGENVGSAAKVRAAVADFLDSPHALPWSGAGRVAAAEIATAFLAACYEDLGTRPDLLDREQLHEALLSHLPRRLDPGAPLASSAPRVVRALLDHLNETRPNANAWSFSTTLEDAEPRFADALAQLGGTAADAPAPEPIRRPGSKLGRNDPCPCGSGKKFKKCCMKSG